MHEKSNSGGGVHKQRGHGGPGARDAPTNSSRHQAFSHHVPDDTHRYLTFPHRPGSCPIATERNPPPLPPSRKGCVVNGRMTRARQQNQPPPSLTLTSEPTPTPPQPVLTYSPPPTPAQPKPYLFMSWTLLIASMLEALVMRVAFACSRACSRILRRCSHRNSLVARSASVRWRPFEPRERDRLRSP